MKKFIYILSSLFMCVLLTACATQSQKGKACKEKHPNVSVNQLGEHGPGGCTYGGYR